MNICIICKKPSRSFPFCEECKKRLILDKFTEDDNDYDESLKNEADYDPKDTEYSNIQSLYTFDSIKNFNDYIKKLYNVENWIISDLPDEDRIELLSGKNYFRKIKKDFSSSNISPYPVTKKEILSYFDTLSLMYKVVNNIDNEDFFYNAKIIMEYVPNNDRGKDRCDYIIAYRNLLIIFEFGRCKEKCQIKNIRIRKNEELDYYKKQIEKIVSKEIIIETQAFIYQPEVNNRTKKENEEEIENTTKLIEKWLRHNYHDAIDYLNDQ